MSSRGRTQPRVQKEALLSKTVGNALRNGDNELSVLSLEGQNPIEHLCVGAGRGYASGTVKLAFLIWSSREDLRLANWTRLARQQACGISLTMGVYHAQRFYVGSGDQT